MYFLTGKMGKALDTDGADNSVDVLLVPPIMCPKL